MGHLSSLRSACVDLTDTRILADAGKRGLGGWGVGRPPAKVGALIKDNVSQGLITNETPTAKLSAGKSLVVNVPGIRFCPTLRCTAAAVRPPLPPPGAGSD